MNPALSQELAELQSVHKGLTHLCSDTNGIALSGPLAFDASSANGSRIADSFEVRLTIPHTYPEALPTVTETQGIIDPAWEHVNPDGTLCLELPIEERRIYDEEPSLLGFVNQLVIPYLYGYRHWKTHGVHPFGEREHGAAGIVAHYRRELELKDESCVLAVLSYLFLHGYRGHLPCPCGRSVRSRNCHGEALLNYYKLHTKKTLEVEFIAVLAHCSSAEVRLSGSLRRQVDRVLERIAPTRAARMRKVT